MKILNFFFLFQTSKSNEMLSGLRYFEHALKDNGRGKPKPSFSWGAVDMASVARCFQQLCIKAVDVFQSEPRLLEVNSPTYVLGELLAILIFITTGFQIFTIYRKLHYLVLFLCVCTKINT